MMALVASALMLLMVVVVMLPPWSVAMVYSQHGAPTHASLEYGPILLCAASVVGFIAMMFLLGTRSEEVRNARQAERQRRLTVAHRH